ncbi:MAG TPA: DUF4340 domain-containing protein [Woeseiaceae bacterium]|nr:DUF4340 domain-containing protein [Woeseiaceae bacterium]
MNPKSIGLLTAVVVLLVVVVLLLQTKDEPGTSPTGEIFLSDFANQADDAESIRIIRNNMQPVEIRRDGVRWLVSNRDDYPADIGKLRNLFIALSKAQVVEEKTSNPDYYSRLGVDDPEKGGSGSKLVIDGDGFNYSIIIGTSAQGTFRYVRLADAETSYMVDQNFLVPESVGDWLQPTIIDIEPDRVRRVTIHNSDGETIEIEKNAEDDTEFSVLAIPEGRELSYPTVANGIAGALKGLTLDDVRKAAPGDAETTDVESTTVFETWDGQIVTTTLSNDGDETWIGFQARQAPGTVPAELADDTADAASGDAEGTDQASTTEANEKTSIQHETVDEINARLSGWQYQIADFKKNLLTRRWSDLLKAVDTDSE